MSNKNKPPMTRQQAEENRIKRISDQMDVDATNLLGIRENSEHDIEAYNLVLQRDMARIAMLLQQANHGEFGATAKLRRLQDEHGIRRHILVEKHGLYIDPNTGLITDGDEPDDPERQTGNDDAPTGTLPVTPPAPPDAPPIDEPVDGGDSVEPDDTPTTPSPPPAMPPPYPAPLPVTASGSSPSGGSPTTAPIAPPTTPLPVTASGSSSRNSQQQTSGGRGRFSRLRDYGRNLAAAWDVGGDLWDGKVYGRQYVMRSLGVMAFALIGGQTPKLDSYRTRHNTPWARARSLGGVAAMRAERANQDNNSIWDMILAPRWIRERIWGLPTTRRNRNS